MSSARSSTSIVWGPLAVVLACSSGSETHPPAQPQANSQGGSGAGVASSGGAIAVGASGGGGERGAATSSGGAPGSSGGGAPGSGGAGAAESGGAGAAGSGGAGACGGPLTFAEPDIEATVRDLIGVPSGPIAPQLVVGLRSLIGLLFADVPSCAPFDCGHPSPPIRDYWITTLDGLECLTDVEELALDSWSVPDFGSLAALPHLTELDLGLAPDLSLLPDLPRLTGLTAMMTTTNLARLASFKALVTLELHAVDLSAPGTLDPLAGLTSLQDLAIVGRVTDLGFLSRLTNLTKVGLGGNNITNLQPLVDNLGIGAGDTVDLTYNPIDCRAQARQLRALRARGVTVLLPACD